MDKKLSSCVILTFSWISVTAGLQCPSCTYITMDAEKLGPAKSIVEGMFASVQDEECAQDLTGPIPQIQEEKCEATTGQVPRCGFYKVSVTIKIPILVTSVDVPLNIFKRGCNLFKTANVPSTGCHSSDDINEDKTIIEQILHTVFTTADVLNLVKFDGELCLCTDTYCRETSSVIQGAKLETSGVSQEAKLSTISLCLSMLFCLV